MTTISHDPADLDDAARRAGASADTLTELAGTVPIADPGMYGLLISQAAGHAEPAASTANRRIVTALGTTTDAVGAALTASAEAYRQVAQAAVDLSGQVSAEVGGDR